MRFSTMAILALSADWATAARINGVIGEELEYPLTKNRELKAKGASKAASSKSSKKSTSDDDSCDTPTSVLTCGGSSTGTVTLTTGLVCSGADFAEGSATFGIIMDGSDAVLDCAGNDVVVDGVAAIVLRNGATAMNCEVHSGEGPGSGVLMDEGDATLIDSHIYNKEFGVFISGDGYRTLTNVRTSGNAGSGVRIVEATGTIVMTNLEANGNGGSGVAVKFAGEGGTVNLVMDGAKLNSNGDDGLFVEGNGNADVELFGTVRAIGNGFRGIRMDGTSRLTVNGKLQASSNLFVGIRLDAGSELAIPQSGTVIACRNSGGDIQALTAQEIIKEDGSTLISDSGLKFEEEACASAPPNQAVAECELE